MLAKQIVCHNSRFAEYGDELDVEYPLAMKLAMDIYQDITPQVQLNIEFPQIKSKMPHTSQSITSSVKISLQNQTFERTQNGKSKVCVDSVNNVASGFLLEDFGAYYSNLSLDILMQKDY